MAKRGSAKLVYQPVSDVSAVDTGAGERGYLRDVIFSPDASAGESLLDVGCNLGLFCREAARRGNAAVGIDADAQAIAKAEQLAAGLVPRPRFIIGDFEDWNFAGERFDIVIALNVVHHLFDPIHALRKMQALACRRIVLEIAQPTWRDRRIVLSSPGVMLARFMPVAWIAESGGLHRVGSRTFLFTRRALRVLFNEHTTAFEPLRFHSSPFKGRLIVEARRRNIGHLVVVAGPTAAGKSTFQERFLSDPAFRGEFVSDEGEWVTTTGYKVNRLPTGRLDRVLMHYDFMRLRSGSLKTYTREPILDLLACAERVTVITLVASTERLIGQLEQGSLSRARFGRLRKYRELRDSYRAPGYLVSWYDAWLDFCSSTSRVQNRMVVENVGEFCIRPFESWRNILEVAGQTDKP
jgi:SAM-dependent methyltransferase